MKKLIMIVSVLVATLLVFPVRVEAVEQSGSYDAPAYGTVEYEWEYENEENGEKIWRFYLTPNHDITYLYLELVPVNVEVTSVEGSNVFALANHSGSNVFLEAAGGVSSGERVLIMTVRTTDAEGADEHCELNISFLNLNCSVSIPGYYFDNDGNPITQEEYNQVCGNTTPEEPETPGDVPNSPETGSVVPYIAIGGGILAIIVVYLFSRKSNKVYKI